MNYTIFVGEQPLELRPVGNPGVPNPVELPPPYLGGGISAGNDVGEDVPTRAPFADCEGLVEEADKLGWCAFLFKRATPGDVAGSS